MRVAHSLTAQRVRRATAPNAAPSAPIVAMEVDEEPPTSGPSAPPPPSSPTHIEQALSTDLLYHVLSLDGVGIGDLGAAQRVCRRWQDVLAIPQAWKRAADRGGFIWERNAALAEARAADLGGWKAFLRRECSLSRRWLEGLLRARLIAEGHEHWVPSILMEPRTHQLVTCSYDGTFASGRMSRRGARAASRRRPPPRRPAAPPPRRPLTPSPRADADGGPDQMHFQDELLIHRDATCSRAGRRAVPAGGGVGARASTCGRCGARSTTTTTTARGRRRRVSRRLRRRRLARRRRRRRRRRAAAAVRR